MMDHTETVPQRGGKKAGSGGGTNQRESRQIQPDRPDGRPFSDHDIDREIFHGRIQHLFHLAVQTVDLVDKKHISLFQIA